MLVLRTTPKNNLYGLIGLIIFAALFIASLFVFSYLLIVGALIGLVVFAINYVKHRFFTKSKSSKGSYVISDTREFEGRTIDHDRN